MNFLSIELDANSIRGITTVLGFANSFMTLAIPQVLGRRIFVRWRMWAWATLVLLWCGIVPCLVEMITPLTIASIDFKNVGTKAGVFIWLIALAMLIYLTSKILGTDLISFRKPEANFSPQEKFGVPIMDTLIGQARQEGKKFYFPVLLVGERASNPHHFAQQFLMSGILEGSFGIYFSFTRPPEIIINQLKHRRFDEASQHRQLIIIDCYTTLVTQGKPARKNKALEERGITTLFADPRNPHHVNEMYERAIKIAIKRGFDKLRVVYDSFSDFLLFADAELIITYLRHNVVWEETKQVQSIYILWPEALEKPMSDRYLTWFSNTPIWLKTEGQNLELKIESLFEQPKTCTVNYKYEIVP